MSVLSMERPNRFRYEAKRIRLIRRSLNCINNPIEIKRKPVEELLPHRNKNFKHMMLLNVFLEFRNQLKILLCSIKLNFMPPSGLFSWSWKDYLVRMKLPIAKYVTKFESHSLAQRCSAKINADIKTLIDITEAFISDIVVEGDFSITIHIIDDMKKLVEIQNEAIRRYLIDEELVKDLEINLLAIGRKNVVALTLLSEEADTTSVVNEDSIDKLDETEIRYRRQYTEAQYEQLKQFTYNEELRLIELKDQLRFKADQECVAFESITAANTQIIYQLEDEVLMISKKYEFECDELDLMCNRKKNQIMALIDNLNSTKEKLQSLLAEMGDDVLKDVEQPTIWAILENLAAKRAALKIAEANGLLRRQQKKKAAKGKRKKNTNN